MLKHIFAALLVMAFVAACGDQKTDESEGGFEAVFDTELFFGESSLEERITLYPTVVRATLNYIGVEVIEGTGRWDDQFTNILKFNLTVHEYLNGSGGNTITAVWGSSKPNDSREAAMEVTTGLVAQRDTTFDDREAIIFLENETWDLFSNAAGDDTYFLSYKDELWRDDGFSLFSKSNKLWLPLVAASEQRAGGTSSNPEYLLALPAYIGNVAHQVNETSTPATLQQQEATTPSISLDDLKAKIAAINEELAVGNSTASYRHCVGLKYSYERRVAWGLEVGEKMAYRDYVEPQDITSGTAKGAVGFTTKLYGWYPDTRTATTLEGEDAALFEVTFGENNPEDLDNDGQLTAGKDSIWYTQTLQTLRPLPAGEYTFDIKDTAASLLECSYVITTPWVVTVTAPTGTLHEVLFNPVTDGTSVAADSTNGILKPASFTDVNSASASLQRIEWASSTVKVKVSPHTGLAGQAVDFIALDGSVSLSLVADDATVDPANNTLSWSVVEQPWHDGDKLMVRIRKTLPAPEDVSVSLSGGTYTISWSAVTGATDYRAQYRTGGSEAEWTDLDATTGTSQTFSPEGGVACSTTYEFRVQARGDGTTYPAEWSPLSESTSHTNSAGACNRPPVFDSATYTFTVSEDASVWPDSHVVGSLSASDPDQGDSLLYYITAGNGAGAFNISSGHHGADIVVWAALDYETTSSYTLTVEARDGKAGGTSSATVEISVTDVAE